MIRTIFSFLLITLLFINCNGQSEGNRNNHQAKQNLPATNYKVNREYDKNGNIIRYDSTYSYYYSNVQNDSVLRDSIFDVFKNQFNKQFFFSNDPFFDDFFFQDSVMNFDFYKKDFFSNHFQNNRNDFDKYFNAMDSIKNEFFNKQFQNNQGPKTKKPVYNL
jgi:hypothetical protein